MKIGLVQFNPTIGDFKENIRRILGFVDEAKRQHVDLLLFPELSVTGYPPRDLLEYPYFIQENLAATSEIAKAARDITVVCGFVEPNRATGKPFFNSAAVLQDGKVRTTYQKHLLPFYDVFDEERHFEPGSENCVFEVKNARCGLTICEDAWVFPPDVQRGHHENPLAFFQKNKVDFLLNISASPFHLGKPAHRLEVFRKVAQFVNAPVVLCNQVGASDELIFDGSSFAMTARGEVAAVANAFEEQLLCFEDNVLTKSNATRPHWPESDEEWLFHALKVGLRDYVRKCGMKKVCLGLSGGVDSCVTAAIAVAALGKESVATFGLPTRFTSKASVEDSETLSRNLGISFQLLSIESLFEAYESNWKNWFRKSPASLTSENLQPRIRMSILMGIANEEGRLLLNTSNKSELAVGFATLYGDSAGAISVLGDVKKNQVYDLARFINRSTEVIPRRVLERAPTAELRENQTDQDTLPPYEMLDRLVVESVEKQKGRTDLLAEGFDKTWVDKFQKLHHSTEYKRRQFPPILKVSPKAFGMGRRIPIAASKD